MDDPEACIPLYLRHQDPMSTPILSHNSSTNNILLKFTVPKRTGRKRKRGSQDPYSGDPVPSIAEEHGGPPSNLRSHSRLDNPRELQRTLQDNPDNYKVEAIAEIDRTHRFRGLLLSVAGYEEKLTWLQVSRISINRLVTQVWLQNFKS